MSKNIIGIFGNCGECGNEYVVFAKTNSLSHRCPNCGIKNSNCNEWYALGDKEKMSIKPQEIIDELEHQLVIA